MKSEGSQFIRNNYLLKYFGKMELVAVGIGLVSLYTSEPITNLIPSFIAFTLHFPPYPPFLDHQSGPTSLYSWIGYLVSGAIVGRIAKKSPFICAMIAGVIYAGVFTFLNEYQLPPPVYQQ